MTIVDHRHPYIPSSPPSPPWHAPCNTLGNGEEVNMDERKYACPRCGAQANLEIEAEAAPALHALPLAG